ncbi:calponin-1-like isoform X4 [Ruditapes philippinarum]|uniref:calponin-1-like isoform X4 n=1 Tax=Ruditapes philippinarum TaxID=129788 RepID=UPI00295A9515|nr:calponin-1-like isoform X4 [Ruditapes philippinarum]
MDKSFGSKAETAEDKRAMFANTSPTSSYINRSVSSKARVAGKYDLQAEAEVRNWIHQLTGEVIEEYELEKRLKDGVILCQLIKTLFDGTPPDSLPPACRSLKPKARKSDKGAIQMANIEIFLTAATAYGVPQSGLFACNDLYEGKNMPMVIATILQVGSEAQRLKFDGPTCGSKPAPRNAKKKFTRQQIRESHSILTPQSGTNKYASQKGMSFGSVRHCADIRADDLDQEGQSELSLQGGTNKFASQKGMSFGSVRHCADIRADDMSQEGQGEVTLQSGTNKFASQKGMRMGAIRHISDIKSDDMVAEGMGELTLQGGTNKFASQKGMSFGAVRHCADIRADDLNQDSAGDIGQQMGTNKFASQKGMRIGAVRHVADIRADDMQQESSGHVNLQSGWNKGASQSGMRGFGAARHVSDIKVTELCDEYEPEEGDEDYEGYNDETVQE